MSLDIILIEKEAACENESEKEVFSANITHNLTDMAAHVPCSSDYEIDLYQVLWHPERIFTGDVKASMMVPHLEYALIELIHAETFLTDNFTPQNGWGNYENLLNTVTDTLRACIKFPDSIYIACN